MLTHNYKNIQKQHTFAACGNITKNKSVFRLPFFGIYCGFFICLFQYEIMLMPWAAWVFLPFDTQTKQTTARNHHQNRNAISQTHSPNLQTKQNIATTLLILPPGGGDVLVCARSI